MKGNLKRNLSEFFMPTVYCGVCKEKTSLLYKGVCSYCLSELETLKEAYKMCDFCGNFYGKNMVSCPYCFAKKEPRSYLLVETCYPYKGVAKDLIRAFKFHNGRYLAPALAKLMTDRYDFVEEGTYDAIVAVPMTKKKIRERGYNQSEELAKELSLLLEIPYFKNALVKSKETEIQSSLEGKARKENVKDAFAVSNSVILEGKSILLVDDIITSGATVNQCSKILKNHGVDKIKVCTFCGAGIEKD